MNIDGTYRYLKMDDWCNILKSFKLSDFNNYVDQLEKYDYFIIVDAIDKCERIIKSMKEYPNTETKLLATIPNRRQRKTLLITKDDFELVHLSLQDEIDNRNNNTLGV